MKTTTPSPTAVGPEEALTLAAWAETYAQSEYDGCYEDWVDKCIRIAEALTQLAALQNTLKSKLAERIKDLETLNHEIDMLKALNCGVQLPKVDGPAVLPNRELASINNQSTTRQADPFHKDAVYGHGPRPTDTK